MRLALIFAALLMLIQGVPASAQQQPAGAGINPRWGLLGELAERDLASFYNGKPSMPATVRWEVPNRVLVWTDWGPMQRAESTFTLDAMTGQITVKGPHTFAGTKVQEGPTGELVWVVGENRAPFLRRRGDGGFHARWGASIKLDYFPLAKAPEFQAKLASLVSGSKVRAADPSLNVKIATAAPTQQQPARQTGTDSRWGLLGELAERDLVQIAALGSAPSTLRWEIPNKRLVWTTWAGLVGNTEFRFTINEGSGRIDADFPNWRVQRELTATPGGELVYAVEQEGERFLWKEGDGIYILRAYNGAKFKFAPIEAKPSQKGSIARLIAAGKLRPADQSLNAQMASAAPAVSQLQQSAPQTYLSTVQSPAPLPASSVAPTVAAAAAVSGPRYALVIGNSQYGASLGRLPNPVNDAQSVASALRAVGFDVDLVVDADQKGMKRAISRFGARLSAARGATGLFYYAGHGIQSRGTNYLIPVSAPIEREADLDLEAVAADTVLAQMEDAGAATSIVILDACRNMPLARSFRSASRGLARMDAPNGSFVAYSTAPGATAADGEGRNSPFAAALVKQLGQKGTPIEVVFRGVRREVVEATGGEQTPWDSSSLLDPFYFVP